MFCRTSACGVAAVLGAIVLSCMTATAQAQRMMHRKGPPAAAKEPSKQPDAEQPAFPPDKRLVSLYQEFITKAEHLAADYEGSKQYDKARLLYEQILKLAPQYQPAQQKVNMLKEREATANRMTFQVWANRGWQDTGVVALAGRPLAIRAQGQWTFTLKAPLGPAGMGIPKELRDFNLGCLVGVIDTGKKDEMKPFVVGETKSFAAEKTGPLYLRMWDIDPEDNQGSLQVEILGTFERK